MSDRTKAASRSKRTQSSIKPVETAKGYEKRTIALVYDFDGTLKPRASSSTCI